MGTTATGCSERLWCCFIALQPLPPSPHPPRTLAHPPHAKCKFERESWHVVSVFHLQLRSFGSWAGNPGKGMAPKSCIRELQQKPNPEQRSPFILIWFGNCGCLSLSAPLLMQTECCLRVVHFLFFCINLSLLVGCFTILQQILFSQWP